MKNFSRHSVAFMVMLSLFNARLTAGDQAVSIPHADQEVPDSLDLSSDLDELVVTHRVDGRRKMKGSAMNVELMTQAELKKAACCNLGESFTTNPSVDVNYSDAASGARQIKLLGLPGTYVQMLTENVPNFRGAAAPFALGYMPGPWMQSIQVSKGASSVKNGYESVTGQINIELLKPQSDQSLEANAYADHHGKVEGNISGNIYLNDKLSSGLLLHGENSFASHDSNGDTFADSPKLRQISAMNRWAWMGEDYIFQAAVKYLGEKREGGQIGHHADHIHHPYIIDITTHRGEFFVKNAYIFDHEHNGNVALILSGSLHDQKSGYGLKCYDVFQKNLYASLMFERDFGEWNFLSAGISCNIDDYHQKYRLTNVADNPLVPLNESETTSGAYLQYTFNYDQKFLIMGGVRYDYSSRFGNMFTPRFHVRFNQSEMLSVHASAGIGYRSPFALADNSYLLASGRQLVIESDLQQEKAWNYGAGLSGIFRVFGKTVNWNAEYYYTDFLRQTIVDLDSPGMALIGNLRGKSFSHAFQAEVNLKILADLTLTGAYRYTRVKVDYGRGVVDKPLTSRSKGLISVNYAPMMGKWQFDVTLAVTGGGRMPVPLFEGDDPMWPENYKAFPTLNAQITRNFRHWSIYAGGENLTNYRQKNPVIGYEDPWGGNFDTTMVYAPLHGALVYVGFRYTFTKYK